jgi:tetratricopeptide (TPR) repeat protein
LTPIRFAAAAAAALSLACAIHDARARDADPLRQATLARAEAELERGDTAAALDAFERAAMMLHAPDTEMGLIRTHMQAGQYRRALAFCAHTAGAHLESASAGALYAWLLQMSGQTLVARRVLNESVSRAAADPVVLQVQRAFAESAPLAEGVLLDPPHRMAPRPLMPGEGGAAPPEAARVASSGVLIDSGRRALIPSASAASAAGSLWVRNGLGDTTAATIDVEQPLSVLNVTVVSLARALDPGPEGPPPSREPFAGSPGFIVEYAASGRAEAAWPMLRSGFLGVRADRTGQRDLGIEVPVSLHGGPIFDASGRLIGMGLARPNGSAAMIPISAWWSAGTGQQSRGLDSATPVARPRQPDEIYETALRLALQVIIVRH